MVGKSWGELEKYKKIDSIHFLNDLSYLKMEWTSLKNKN